MTKRTNKAANENTQNIINITDVHIHNTKIYEHVNFEVSNTNS